MKSISRRWAAQLLIASSLIAWVASAGAADYLPPKGTEWARRTPEQAGFDAAKLQAAINFAIANENPEPRDLALAIALTRAREPYDAIIGPTQPRGDPTGLVVRGGYVVAQWGEPDRVDVREQQLRAGAAAAAGDRMPDLPDAPHARDERDLAVQVSGHRRCRPRAARRAARTARCRRARSRTRCAGSPCHRP